MPAAFTPQDNTGLVEGANAYIDVAFMRQYFLDRGNSLSTLTDDQLKVGIVLATDYVDNRWRLRFVGRKLTEGQDEDGVDLQSTEWPRDTKFIGLPAQLKKATAEYALRAAQNGELVSDAPIPVVDGEVQPTGQVLETTVDIGGAVMESKKYAESAGGYGSGTITTEGCLLPEIPAADMLIEYLLAFQSRQRRAIR